MSMKGIGEKIQQAAIGLQELLRFDAVPNGSTILGKLGLEVGEIDLEGTYDAHLDVAGCADAEVHIRASAVTGTVTPSAFITYADGVTSKAALTDDGAGGLVADERRTFSIADLKGVRRVVVRLVIDTGGAVTLDQFEANAA